MKHAVVRTDNLSATHDGSKLVTVRFYDAEGKAAKIDNGNIVALAGLDANETKIYKAVAPTADTAELVLIATPELMYDERLKNLEDFVNPEGGECRGYVLHRGDVLAVTAEAFDAAVVEATIKGAKVGTTGTKLTAVTDVADAKLAYLCKEVVGAHTYYKLRVL